MPLNLVVPSPDGVPTRPDDEISLLSVVVALLGQRPAIARLASGGAVLMLAFALARLRIYESSAAALAVALGRLQLFLNRWNVLMPRAWLEAERG